MVSLWRWWSLVISKSTTGTTRLGQFARHGSTGWFTTISQVQDVQDKDKPNRSLLERNRKNDPFEWLERVSDFTQIMQKENHETSLFNKDVADLSVRILSEMESYQPVVHHEEKYAKERLGDYW